MPETQAEPYAAAIRKLLKGVVYHDDPFWNQIRDYELPIREYLAQIGLAMHLDEIGNFAYIYDQSRDDELALPPLTSRRSLTFLDTLLMVLLRERLDEHEMRDLDQSRLILKRAELHELIIVFMGDHPDARKVENRSNASISRLMNYGFLTKQRDDSFQVRPLLRSRMSADQLAEVKKSLETYLQTDSSETGEPDDE